MAGGNSAYVISPDFITAITEGISTEFEGAMCHICGANTSLGKLEALTNALGYEPFIWTTAYVTGRIETILTAVSEMIFNGDLEMCVAEMDGIAAAAGHIFSPGVIEEGYDCEVFMRIVTDEFLMLWREVATACFRATANSDTRRAAWNADIAQQARPMREWLPSEQFVTLALLDTDEEYSDMSLADLPVSGAWVLVDATRLTPAAERISAYVRHEYWATTDD